jgi:hypothetical protein
LADGQCPLATLNSVPEFDGYHHWTGYDGCWEEYVYGQGIIIDSEATVRDKYFGIITFDLGAVEVDWQKVSSVSIRVFALDYVNNHPDQVYLEYFNIPDEYFPNVQDCGLSCSHINCFEWGHPGMYYPLSRNQCGANMIDPVQNFMLTSLGQGWYEVSSPNLTELIVFSWQKQYLTFTLSDYADSVLSDMHFEDGENSGGTGNIPTLSVEYSE